ncbi:MAG: IS110 family transposase, partial [Vicinamibacterales bacterium]
HRRSTRPSRRSSSVLERIQIDVAGIDCGAAEHYVSVPPDRDPTPIQSFRTFTADLERLADWLVACRITSVAMEATGVYWIPVYDILETRGIEVLLVNARHVKHVPGRKSDVEDCEWLRELHSVGLLRGSFRPAGPILALRALVRHRDVLVQTAGTYVQRMQKALTQMNLLLPRVVSDIVGKTGLAILRDLVGGERDPHVLAQHRDPHCKATEEEIVAALTGHDRPEHLFVLQQNLELFDMCQTQLAACDAAIETELQTLTAAAPPPTTPLPRPRVTRRRGNEPHMDLRPVLHHLTGVDLTQIDGLAPYSVLKLLAEIGTDPTRWPTEHHFTAWLTLAPQNRVSGGRRLSSKTQPSANRAAGVLRVAAMSLVRSQTALGAFYRRLAVRIGKPKAITATARKLAILVYRTLAGTLIYKDPGADIYNARQRARLLRRLRQRADTLGFALINRETGELLGGTVS